MSNNYSLHNDTSQNDEVDKIMSLKLDLANALTESDHGKHVAYVTMIENKALRSQLEETMNRCSQFEKKNAELSEVVRHLQKNAKAKSIEKSELRVQLEACQVQREQYKGRLDPLTIDNSRLKSECEELMAGIVVMRLELERTKIAPKNSRRSLEMSPLHLWYENGSISPMDDKASRHKSNVTQASMEHEILNDEEIAEKEMKVVAKSVKKWSEITFGRRHSAIKNFFDDEILNYQSGDDGNTIISCGSEDLEVDIDFKHRNNSNSSLEKNLQYLELKTGQNFQPIRRLFMNKHRSSSVNERHRFSLSTAVHDFQSQLPHDNQGGSKIIKGRSLYNGWSSS